MKGCSHFRMCHFNLPQMAMPLLPSLIAMNELVVKMPYQVKYSTQSFLNSFLSVLCALEILETSIQSAVIHLLSRLYTGKSMFLIPVMAFVRLCDLVVRLPDCRPRGPGFGSRCYQIFWVAVGLEWGPLSPCEDKWGATWKKSNDSSL
jgi:hypothetical protein